ncbi:glycosyl transferase family 2 [Pseudodesulfovibrio mercurii]|uniref:Glycosyl transferase family 2 n=1 Tax=Pseudodesulfovibrio mercurii TaxID=641491 RepID=F0JID3_9BACT|nr:glycosyltransferase family 2 protein [Pseudodesulfovibrio mercurii]EGB14185.1 glycosyl transferase family 2 [Pseudodesulfovibrio mercurii]
MESTTVPVSVLLCVHNGDRYVAEAIESILSQTLSRFEFVIVDDASTNGTPALLDGFARRNPRIRLFRLEENQGLTRALNYGLEQCTGKYIARIDDDDRSLPDRLQRQFDFLEQHPDHVAVACGHHVIDETGRIVSSTDEALDSWQIRWIGGFNPPAPHPTYFFHRLAPDGSAFRYDPVYRTAQDFDLWSRMAMQGETAVLGDILVEYRRHPAAITVSKRREQAANCRRIGETNLRNRLPEGLLADLEPLLDMWDYTRKADPEGIRRAVAGVNGMLAHDLPHAPDPAHRRWTRRMAAGLLADALLSRGGGLHSVRHTLTFLRCAFRHLPFLAYAAGKAPRIALKSFRAVSREH